MRFIDRVRIQIHAGDGGKGIVAWRREAHVPQGGPAGGDGGNGGDVWLVADEQLATLLDVGFRRIYRATGGRPGSGQKKNGKAGEDLIIRVPVGTTVFFEGAIEHLGEPRPWEQDEDEDDEDDTLAWNPDDLDVFDSSEPEPEPDADEEPESASETSEASEASDDEGELENVWIAEPSRSSSRAVDDDDRDPVLDGAPREIRESISAGAQRQRMAEHPREAPPRSPRREPGEQIGDLDHPGAMIRIAHGGHGGRGNVHFASSTNRSPDRAEPGTPGEAMWLRLELKLLADVGIVGYPNVGKSTLISRISRARPEIADYPFTTLAPQLGVVTLSGERTMVVADVPGLIDGASEGKGLGHEFLRHLERTRVLLHLLAPDPTPGREVLADLDALEGELRRYGDMFEGRPRVVALNKLDTPESQALVKRARRALRERNIPLFPISALTGEGVDALLEALWRRLDIARKHDSKADPKVDPE
jgi:GTP-binding protein